MENILSNQAKEQGFKLKEDADVLELWYEGKLIARFTQTGVDIKELQVESERICLN